MSAVDWSEGPPYYLGNASQVDQQDGNRGWFVGWFIDTKRGLCQTRDVEVKWGEHREGEARTTPGTSAAATTLTLLVRGVFVVEFPDLGESVTLRESGDYVVYPPGVAHVWKAVTDCVVVTVRWPSV